MTDQPDLDGRIVTGQMVPEDKRVRARELRQEMTPAEQVLWQHLRAGRLGVHFRRQQVIDGFIVDFYCHSARLVVEVDGAVHTDEDTKAYDAERDAVLRRRSLTILRFWNSDVLRDLPSVLRKIKEALSEEPIE